LGRLLPLRVSNFNIMHKLGLMSPISSLAARTHQKDIIIISSLFCLSTLMTFLVHAQLCENSASRAQHYFPNCLLSNSHFIQNSSSLFCINKFTSWQHKKKDASSLSECFCCYDSSVIYFLIKRNFGVKNGE